MKASKMRAKARALFLRCEHTTTRRDQETGAPSKYGAFAMPNTVEIRGRRFTREQAKRRAP